MTNFFSDIFDAATGQQVAPQQTIINTNDLLNQAYGTATAQAPNVIAYNQALAPGLTNVQLGVERQYDPNIANLRAATSKSILDELALGGSLPQDLQDQVIQKALAGAAASGFGVGQGGRGLVAADLGLTGLQLANQRRDAALKAVRTSPGLNDLFQVDRGISPGAIAQDIRGVTAAQDELANLQEDIRRKNFASLLNTGGRILGTAAGAYFGGAAGAKMGGDIGGSLITGSGVRGQESAAPNKGGMFTSILSGLGGLFNRGGGGGGANWAGPDASGGAGEMGNFGTGYQGGVLYA